MTTLTRTAMSLTHICTGCQSSRLLVVVLVVFLSNQLTGASLENRPPKIIQMKFGGSGDRALMSCRADPGSPDDFTVIYWLVNQTFPGGRFHESEERAMEVNGQTLIEKHLRFGRFQAEDYRSNFTCVVNSPVGMDRVTFRFPRKNNEKHRNQKRAGKGRRRRQMVMMVRD